MDENYTKDEKNAKLIENNVNVELQGISEKEPRTTMPDKIADETFFTLLKELIVIALPNTFSYLLSNINDLLALHFVGLLGIADYTAAVGLGMMWFNISAYSILLGLASVIDTLVSQSFGAKEIKMCSNHLITAFVIITIVTFPLLIIIIYASPILCIFGIEQSLSIIAGKYVFALLPNLFIFTEFELLRKFLNGQQIVNPQMVIVIITSVLHPLWCYLFIFPFNFSFIGAAYAKVLTSSICMIFTLIYCLYKSLIQIPSLPELKEMIAHSKVFLELAFPSVVMICFDWWAYELMTLLSGNLGSIKLAANVALVNMNLFFYMIPVGLGTGSGVLVGNMLGEGNIQKAKNFIKLSILFNLLVISLLSIILLIFNKFVAEFFSLDPEVISLIRKLFWVLILVELFDTGQGNLQRILVGMGRQRIASILIVISYYCIMLPLCALFIFYFTFGLYGVWAATGLSACTLFTSYVFFIYKEDWISLVKEVQDRIKSEKK